jgi:hypothetical protein
MSNTIQLPLRINQDDVDSLTHAVAEFLQYGVNRNVTRWYDECEMQPTSRAAWLAASAAVAVLLVHEIGQEVR